MVAVLLSGGLDSAYCLLSALATGNPVRSFFFDYGQSYYLREREAVLYLQKKYPIASVTVVKFETLRHAHGVFDSRNEKFVRWIFQNTGVRRIFFGCRNPLALLDRFGDSNWQWARKLGKMLGVTIETPCVLLPKGVIRRKLIRAGVDVTRLYSTENHNGTG